MRDMAHLYQFISLILLLLPSLCLAAVSTHDSSFIPDQILRVTAQNVTMNCESRYSVVVNGTVPGPEVRITEGKVSWIRVYNDMTDHNLTIVRSASSLAHVFEAYSISALAWTERCRRSFLGRNASG